MTKIFPQMKKSITGQRGAVAITVAIMMFMLFGLAAFAIDFGYSYTVKNELQNAADAAALAGASVLFTDPRNCLSSGSPYSCCTGIGEGSGCIPGMIDVNDVTLTAMALADMNNSGGNATTVTVEIGHYGFASTWGFPGDFIKTENNEQMDDWASESFSALNINPDFINAVRVTVARTDVPRFFSRIWSSNDLTITDQAIAYLGFTGALAPGEIDEPIAVCEGFTSCNVATMLNNNSQTARWTDFDQETCGTASANDIRNRICNGGNTTPIKSIGMSTTNATNSDAMMDMYACWINGQYDSDGDGVLDTPIDTDSDGKPDKPWQITLPVIDCTGNNNCRKVVGAVVVNVIWINDQGMNDAPDKNNPWVPSSMYNPITESNWTCTGSGTECWDDFQDNFNLQNNNNSTGPVAWTDSTLYFLPDCREHAPTGGTGVHNFGILARHPVLVK